MASTVTFKTNAVSRQRYMTTEDTFANGMKFTDAPKEPGFAKAMVNFDIKNDGESMVPRGGLHDVSEVLDSINGDNGGAIMHHAGTMYMKKDNDVELHNYALCAPRASHNQWAGLETRYAVLIIDNGDGTYSTADYARGHDRPTLIVHQPELTSMHGIDFETPSSTGYFGYNKCIPCTGVYASLEANTYVLGYNLSSTGDKVGNGHLYRMVVDITDPDSPEWYFEGVTPKEVQPAQALNYGYNMFKSNPYTFTNTSSAAGTPVLTGILPYDAQGMLLLTARPGTEITFELFYKYPAADASDKYLFQWEIQDLNSNNNASVVQPVRKSAEYIPGSSVKLVYTPAFNAFSVVVKLFKKTEIASQDATWEADAALKALMTKDEHLIPNQVITLASYYLTNNSNSSMLNVAPVAYDLSTATGMCSWQQRLVLWGVTGAKGTLFVSEVNDPSYIPYPNNSEIFSDDIVCAVPHMSNLLVFTRTALYRITLNADGLSYTTACVQERLDMTPADANTVLTVQNMVYFKSGNYFYMIVPNPTAMVAGTMQLAPVTRPIEYFLNDFSNNVIKLLNDMYNFSYDEYNKQIEVELCDYYVYLDNNQIRNTYKFAVFLPEAGKEAPALRYFDISLNYDTVLRAWTTYCWEASPRRLSMFKPTVTSSAVFLHMFDDPDTWEDDLNTSTCVYIRMVSMDTTNPADTMDLGHITRKYGNYQYLDTGYRNISPELKKRFREVQFNVNTLTQKQLRFYTSFIVDDAERLGMYDYHVSYCTDTNDPNFGVLYVERNLAEPFETKSTTTLGTWTLDSSVFPDLSVIRVRYRVSGKGYGGSIKLLSLNETPYELLNVSWVYRTMFAR